MAGSNMRQNPFQFNSLASAGGGGHNADPFAQNGCHPLTAAILSLIPGLGQLYVGDRRKGIIFLDVAAVNAILLWLMLFTEPMVRTVSQFGASFHFRLNGGVIDAVRYAHLGSPASLLIVALMSLFVLYAARDAYDRAFGLRRKQIYGDSVIELSEATSGSYIFHFALMISFAILALFFLIPPPRAAQVVEIVFTDTPPVTTHEKVVSKVAAPAAAVAHGHKQPDKLLAAARSAASAHVQPTQTAAKSEPAHAAAKSEPSQAKAASSSAAPRAVAAARVPTPVRVAPPPMPMPHVPQPTAAPPAAAAGAALPTPQPKAASSTPQNPSPLPTPHMVQPNAFSLPFLSSTPSPARLGAPAAQPLAMSNKNLIAAIPAPSGLAHTAGGPPGLGQPHQLKAGSDAGSSGAAPGVMGVPRQTEPGSSAPAALAAVGSHNGPAGNGTSTGAPLPRRAISDNGPIGTWSVTPNVGSYGPQGKHGTSGKDRTGTDANNEDGTTDRNVDDGRPQPAVTVSPDFGPYMADLQRRIKRHWCPKQDQLSRKVMVRFNVSLDGTMSNLQLVRTSGDTLADKAALDAVQSASPFAHLPQHAKDAVDVEFTFDYNVFSGRSPR